MKKVVFILALFLSMIFSVHSQEIQVGSGTGTSPYVPISNSKNYSYSQSIYLKEEINPANQGGKITYLKFYYQGVSSLDSSQDLDIYLGYTDKSSFSSRNDWEPVTNLTQVVFDGTFDTGAAEGWIMIPIDPIHQFTYDGSRNLVVAVEERKASGKETTSDLFRYTTASVGRSIYYHSDSETFFDLVPPVDPTSLLATGVLNYFPNIVFGGIVQGCPAPTHLAITNIGATSATVSWGAPDVNPEGGSDYYWSTANVPPTKDTEAKGSVGAGVFSANLSGLAPGTKYYVWVRNNCGSETLSNWSDSASFTTLCVPVTVLNEKFDNITTPNLPSCWSKIISGGLVCPSAYIKTSPVSYTSSAPNALEMFNCNSSGAYDLIAVTPALSNIDKTHRLRFTARGAGTIQIGTLTDNTDPTTFHLVRTVEDLSAALTEYIIDFAPYNNITSDTYIGLRASELNPQQNYIFIDNVIWETTPFCPDVTQVKINSVTSNSAIIAWSEGAGSPAADHWDIAVAPLSAEGPTTFESTTQSGTFEIKNINGVPIEPLKTYKAWVRSVCPGAGGEGSWIGPVTFTTDCPVLSGFSETFDVGVSPPFLPQCWSSIIRVNNASSTIANGTKIATVGAVYPSEIVAKNYVMIKNNGSTGDFDLILVSPPLDNVAGLTHRLKFWTRWEGAIEVGTLDSNTSAGIFTPYKTVTTNLFLNEYVVYFDKPLSVTNQHYIGLRLPTGAGLFAGMSFDNVVWETIPLCPEVSQISVPETTVSTAKIAWTRTPFDATWEVAIGDASVTDANTDPNGLDISPVDGTNSTIDPITLKVKFVKGSLNSGTAYNVWVRSICGGVRGSGAWVGPVKFITECEPVPDFSEGFDNVIIPPTPNKYYTDTLPPCWTKIIRGAGDLSPYAKIQTANIFVETFPKFTPPNYVNIDCQGSGTNSDIILVSPNISTLGQGLKYRLKFDYAGRPGYVQLGTLDGNTNESNFYPFGDPIFLSANNVNPTAIIDFSHFDGDVRPDNNHIGFRIVSGDIYANELWIDNIVWEQIPECKDFTDVVGVTLTTPTSATVVKFGSDVSTWQVAVDKTKPSDATINSIIDINNLTPGTTYIAWVRTVCPGGKYGGWVYGAKFVTPCEAVNVPYAENFETTPNTEIPVCTDSLTTSGSYWQNSQTGGPYGFGGTWALRCFASGDATDAWWFTRGVNLEQGKSYKISYDKGTSAPTDIGICQGGNCGPVNLEVLYGFSPTVQGMTPGGAMTGSIHKYENLTGPKTSDLFNFTVPASGVYYFAFHNFSNSGHANLSIDNIVVDSALSSDDFDLSKFDYYPNPVKDVLNISYTDDIKTVSVFNLLGQNVLTQSINTNRASIDMSVLVPGAYLLKVSTDNSVRTVKIIKE